MPKNTPVATYKIQVILSDQKDFTVYKLMIQVEYQKIQAKPAVIVE